MAKLRAAVGNRRLEDVIEFDKNAKTLGKGTFGTVWKARMKSDHRKAAVKVIEKAKLQQMKVPKDIVTTEVEMMRECSGNNCNLKERFVQLFDFLESNNKYYLILEFCAEGNLQDAAMGSEAGLGEQHVRLLMVQMLESIVFLHSKLICHRDIKPHNYLVCGNINSQSVKIKLGDFGTAVRIAKNQLLKDQVGTPAFMAPEMHLLPAKSSGYDHKVDVWAIGVCMVFLLASEYPFIDGSGRLLRHKLIQGDVPLWEANAFQNLYNGFQEAVGFKRKSPSKIAINLTRRLLAPRRQDRPSASGAMKHDWFQKPGIIDEPDTGGEALPLLDMRDFQVGFSAIERELQSAMDVIGRVEIGINDNMPHIDPSDERLQSCVVCYGAAGSWGYVCPQCYHTVCTTCLERLPKAICPYCRHEAHDMKISQAFTVFRRKGSEQMDSIMNGASNYGNVAVDIDLNPAIPMSHEDKERMQACQLCQKPAASTNYVCPSCYGNLCFDCAKTKLAAKPQCPSCGEVDRVRASLPQYLAASEAWSTAASIGEAVSRQFSEFTSSWTEQGPSRTFSGGFEEVARRFSTPIMMTEPVHHHACHEDAVNHARRSQSCCMCKKPSSMLDHVCPCCNTSVCAACIQSNLSQDPHCPNCKDRERNSTNMQMILHASKARDVWTNLWGAVTGTA